MLYKYTKRWMKRWMAVLMLAAFMVAAAPLATAEAAPASEGIVHCSQTHTVQRGENLFRIAKRYGTTYQVLQTLNGLPSANHIYTGQKLCVQAVSQSPVEGTGVRDIVALATVRIRNGPGTGYLMIGRLFAGEGAGVSGVSPDHKWWRIQCGIDVNGNCWVSADPNLTRPVDHSTPNPDPIRETGEAVVENISIQTLESYPVQVVAVLHGYLPDACVNIQEVRQVRESTTFRIRMTTQRRIDALCTAVPVRFNESVQLEVAGLPAGDYDVRVNNLVMPFTLASAQAPGNGGLVPVNETTVRYVQAQANLRLRNGPSQQAAIIGRIAAGQTSLVTGISLNGAWWRVVCPDDSISNCFISADRTLTRVTDGF